MLPSPVLNGYHSGDFNPPGSHYSPVTEPTLVSDVRQESLGEPSRSVRFLPGETNAKVSNGYNNGAKAAERPRCDTPVMPSSLSGNARSRLNDWVKRAMQPVAVAEIVVFPTEVQAPSFWGGSYDQDVEGYRFIVTCELYYVALKLGLAHRVIGAWPGFWRGMAVAFTSG